MSHQGQIPYGRWICADGREVLFDRRYLPIWQRGPGALASLADPKERVAFEHQEWFFNDDNPPDGTPQPAAAAPTC